MQEISKTPQLHASSSVTQRPEVGRSSTPSTEPNAPDRPKRKIWPWVAGLIIVGVAAWIGVRQYSSAQAAANAKTKTAPPAQVVAVVAHKGDIPVYFTGLGAVTPIYTVTVKSRVDGQIMNVHYTEGQGVQKDQPLVEIDPRPYQVQLAQAEGQLLKDQALLENAQTDLQRYQTLIQKNAVAQQIYATQKSTVAQDEANVKTDQANIAAARLNITYCHITSPIAGRVGLRLVDPGNLITAAAASPLVVITQIEPISVIFTLPEEQIPAVLRHMRGGEHLKVDALDRDSKSTITEGDLTTVDNEIDQTTGTLKFRATFANRDGGLFPNQFVNARLLVEEKKSVTLVANAAIQRNGTSTFLYVVEKASGNGGGASPGTGADTGAHASRQKGPGGNGNPPGIQGVVKVRSVTIGTTGTDESEVVSGAEPGDVVITQGVDKLQDGSPVQAQVQSGNSSVAAAPDAGSANPPGQGQRQEQRQGGNSGPDGKHQHGKPGSNAQNP